MNDLDVLLERVDLDRDRMREEGWLPSAPCSRRHVTFAGIAGWLLITIALAYFGAHVLVATGVGR